MLFYRFVRDLARAAAGALGIFLVIILCLIKRSDRFYLCNNRFLQLSLLLVADFFGNHALRLVQIKNRRTVVCADIRPLAVQLRRIVQKKKWRTSVSKP